jgi:hypothetical protein
MNDKTKDVPVEEIKVVEQIKPKRDITLAPARMQLSEYLRNDWVVTAEQGTTLDDIVNPAFFAHMASQMKAYDHVEVRVDDGSWLSELLVLQVERNWVRVRVLTYYDLADNSSQDSAPSVYETAWKGPHLKWSVIRKSDHENIKSGFVDRVSADAALRDLERLAA